MDRFVQLRGEEALARLMLQSMRPKALKKPKVIGRASNRLGHRTDHVTERIEHIKSKYASQVVCVSDIVNEFGCSRGQGNWTIAQMVRKFEAHRVPRIHGEAEYRYRIGQA